MTSGINRAVREEKGDKKDVGGGTAPRGPAPLRNLMASAALLLATLAAAGAGPTAPRDTLDLGGKPSVGGLAFSPDGKTLAVLNYGRGYSLTLWDIASKKQVAALKREGWSPSRTFAFTSDGGSLLALGGGPGREQPSVAVWDVKTYALSRDVDLELDVSEMREGVLTPDGKSLIVGTRSFGVWIFDLKTGKQSNDIQLDERPQVAEILALALAPDGKTLAVGTKNGSVFVCDVEKGKVRHKLQHMDSYGAPECVERLAFSPDGQRLLSTCHLDNKVEVWDPDAGKNLDFFRFPRWPEAFVFAPDGKTLALVGPAVTQTRPAKTLSRVELWDIGMGGLRDDFSGESPAPAVISCAAFSPDGKTLVTAGSDTPVEFWDVPAGAPKRVRRNTSLPPPPAHFTNQPGAAPPP